MALACCGCRATGSASAGQRSAAETEKAVRATARQAKKDKVDEQLRRAALPLIALIEGGIVTDTYRLEKTKLISLLIFYNATVVGMRQKPKAELAALVKQIPRVQVLLSTAHVISHIDMCAGASTTNGDRF